MQKVAVACALSLLLFSAADAVAVDHLLKGGHFLGANISRKHCKRDAAKIPGISSYGKNACPCVGIDNLPGFFATQVDSHHVQYPLDLGASCQKWDQNYHPACKAAMPPSWCQQGWCYVDPCHCDLPVVPKKTTYGLNFQGHPAYWSYNTCGATDFFTADVSESSCIAQKEQSACLKNPECGWDGKQCLGKEALAVCDAKLSLDTATHGREDCRCVGHYGHKNGRAALYIDETRQASYDPGVGATCGAWEKETHPDCLKDGQTPSFCMEKWCFVDPCKCSGGVPPRTVMSANGDLRYQGKTVYWSYDTCGSKDQWSGSMEGEYCVTQTTEAGCKKLEKCVWNEGKCIGRALAEICVKQKETGVLGVEVFSDSSTVKPFAALLAMLGALLAA